MQRPTVAARGSVAQAQATRAFRAMRLRNEFGRHPIVGLLALRIQDADQVVAMRGIVHCGAVDIAEERLLGVQ
jgi:hypothetical protein